ncbi:MAG: PEP-CTERM sorting domain-containing protein [Chlorobiaceae bacterium]|nr:PEP-CTERM sorting domain-containing protein [Chlorobiaceae bacterium]
MKKRVSASLTLLVCLALHGHAQAFDEISYDDFSTTSGLTLSGDAHKAGDVLRLTDAQAWSMGSAFGDAPQNIDNFNASFSFQYSGYGHEYGSADGIVFVIKSISSGEGVNGGSMGYRGIAHSIGVEFDNWYNPEYGDPANHDNHIGINTNGSVNSIAIYNINPAEFNGTGTWYGWVDYDGITLSASTNQSGIKPAEAMLSSVINIPEVVGSYTGLAGFTAATGAAYQNHDILSFQYTGNELGGFGGEPVPEPSTLLLLSIGGAVIAFRSRNKG